MHHIYTSSYEWYEWSMRLIIANGYSFTIGRLKPVHAVMEYQTQQGGRLGSTDQVIWALQYS